MPSDQTSNPKKAASAISSRTEFRRILVGSWMKLCFSASQWPRATNHALQIGLSVSTSLIAITKDPEIIFDPGGTSSSRKRSHIPCRTKFSISCFRARSASSLRIRGSLLWRTFVMRTLGISFRLTVEDLYARLEKNSGSDEFKLVRMCSPDIMLSYLVARST